MIGDKKHIGVWKLTNDFRALYLKFVKTPISAMGKASQNPDKPLL
jgi:hypothetical protein